MRAGKVYLVFLIRSRPGVFCAIKQDSPFLDVCVISLQNWLQICTLQSTYALFFPLSFKSCSEVFIIVWNITH